VGQVVEVLEVLSHKEVDELALRFGLVKIEPFGKVARHFAELRVCVHNLLYPIFFLRCGFHIAFRYWLRSSTHSTMICCKKTEKLTNAMFRMFLHGGFTSTGGRRWDRSPDPLSIYVRKNLFPKTDFRDKKKSYVYEGVEFHSAQEDRPVGLQHPP